MLVNHVRNANPSAKRTAIRHGPLCNRIRPLNSPCDRVPVRVAEGRPVVSPGP